MKKKKTIKKEVLNFNAVFIEENDGGFSVSVPSLPGCFSQGNNFEEAVRNVREAIELYLEDGGRDELGGKRARKEFMAPVEVNG